MGMAPTDLKPGDVALVKRSKLGMMPDKEGNENAFRGSFDQHCSISEEEIAVCNFDVACNETLSLGVAPKDSAQIYDARYRDHIARRR